MTISELIKELEKVKAEHGEDVLVVVSYRDEGGDYYGFDSDLRLEYGEDGSKEDNYRDEVSVPKEKNGTTYWCMERVPKIFIL